MNIPLLDKVVAVWPFRKLPRAPNGFLPLRLGRKDYVLTGGPYVAKPWGHFGVKLAPEVPGDYDVIVPIVDFGVPSVSDMRLAVLETFAALRAGRQVYAGCMGGIGRTGTFLAVMAKVAGVKEPVAYVRAFYLSHAVETKAQEEFVANFDVRELSAYIKKETRSSVLNWFDKR